MRENAAEMTLTLDFGYEAGLSQTYTWLLNFMNGIFDRRSMSVITFGPGGYGDEVSRRNYYEVFPILFQQVDGFQHDVKGRFRLILSYDLAEDVL